MLVSSLMPFVPAPVLLWAGCCSTTCGRHLARTLPAAGRASSSVVCQTCLYATNEEQQLDSNLQVWYMSSSASRHMSLAGGRNITRYLKRVSLLSSHREGQPTVEPAHTGSRAPDPAPRSSLAQQSGSSSPGSRSETG